MIQGPLGLDAAIFEDDDVIGPAEGGPAVGDDQTGGLTLGEDALPQGLLGVDVEGAGEVVEDEEFRLPDEHAGSAGPLDLPAGETHPPGANQRIQPRF